MNTNSASTTYVDGFVLPIPKNKMEQYRTMAAQAGSIWKEHGALQYCEAAGDDMAIEGMLGFPQLAGAGPDETVVFAWIVYPSREQRDEINAKVMADPRLKDFCNQENLPFDSKRMAYGGFKVIVDA